MRGLEPESDLSDAIQNLGIRCFDSLGNLSGDLAVAVSGGSDSMALLRLAHVYCGQAHKKIVALTVDHGLRAASADEARQVAAWCDDLGVEHHILHWEYQGKGNLSAVARDGRYRLMADFCWARGIEHLYTGHTVDDQAETVLMRLARGSGVDGLAGMARETPLWGITVVRPFVLDQTRERLREILREFGQEWIDDPTNDDPSYDRVKARQVFEHLEPLGISVSSLSGLAHRMGLAKQVLQHQADELIQNAVFLSPMGFAELDVNAFADAETETACRVIGQTINLISGNGGRPRLSVEEEMLEWMLKRDTTGGKTFAHCTFRPNGDRFNILREVIRCAPKTQPAEINGLWDGRFYFDIVSNKDVSGLQVGALGEVGIAQIPKDNVDYSVAWLAAPREARLATPALWRGDVLVNAPLAPWTAETNGPELVVKARWSK